MVHLIIFNINMHFVVVEVENRAPEAILHLKREADGLKTPGEMKCMLHNCKMFRNVIINQYIFV